MWCRIYSSYEEDTDRQTDRQTDRHTDRQTHRHTDTDTQTHTHTHTYIHTYIHTHAYIHTYIHAYTHHTRHTQHTAHPHNSVVFAESLMLESWQLSLSYLRSHSNVSSSLTGLATFTWEDILKERFATLPEHKQTWITKGLGEHRQLSYHL